MNPILLIVLLFLTSLNLSVLGQEKDIVVPYTLADRDRSVRTETKLETLESKMDIRFEAVNEKFDSVNERFEAVNDKFDNQNWILGILLALNLFTLGYTIWDRRTALKPALDKAIVADAKSNNLIKSLREYSKKHPDLAEILKSHGIL